MLSLKKKMLMAGGAKPGQVAFTTPGTYAWTVPKGVKSVCVVCVGGGGSYNGALGYAGGGGALRYGNFLSVMPGQSIPVVVGGDRGSSSFMGVVAGGATRDGSGQGIGGVGSGGSGGGSGGSAFNGSAGGGAGGYEGKGGDSTPSAQAGIGGGGGGGTFIGAGGGVGLLGRGDDGAAGIGNPGNGMPGSGGAGVMYGGGSGGEQLAPGTGAVRIIWGAGRSFPATRTGDL